MGYLTKEQAINRDESGNLLPEVITVEYWMDEFDNENNIIKKPKIKYLPISKGKFNEIFSKTENGETDRPLDEKIILNHCIHPKFNENDLQNMSAGKITALMVAIFSGSSGKTQQETKQIMERKVQAIHNLNEEYLEKKE